MKKLTFILAVCAFFVLTGCESYHHSMREPAALVELKAADFEISDAFVGIDTVTRVLAVDWEHLFGVETLGASSNGIDLPIIGQTVNGDARYALYDLMQKHPGYDVIFYPQVEVHKKAPVLGTDIFSVTVYKVTARLGKLKKQ